jgi:hypothetical protein
VSPNCQHKEFDAVVDVTRLVDQTPIAFSADIRVRCATCGEAFAFIGDMPVGLLPNGPAVSPDGTELRVPLVPGSQPRIPRRGPGYKMSMSGFGPSDMERSN